MFAFDLHTLPQSLSSTHHGAHQTPLPPAAHPLPFSSIVCILSPSNSTRQIHHILTITIIPLRPSCLRQYLDSELEHHPLLPSPFPTDAHAAAPAPTDPRLDSRALWRLGRGRLREWAGWYVDASLLVPFFCVLYLYSIRPDFASTLRCITFVAVCFGSTAFDLFQFSPSPPPLTQRPSVLPKHTHFLPFPP